MVKIYLLALASIVSCCLMPLEALMGLRQLAQRPVGFRPVGFRPVGFHPVGPLQVGFRPAARAPFPVQMRPYDGASSAQQFAQKVTQAARTGSQRFSSANMVAGIGAVGLAAVLAEEAYSSKQKNYHPIISKQDVISHEYAHQLKKLFDGKPIPYWFDTQRFIELTKRHPEVAPILILSMLKQQTALEQIAHIDAILDGKNSRYQLISADERDIWTARLLLEKAKMPNLMPLDVWKQAYARKEESPAVRKLAQAIKESRAAKAVFMQEDPLHKKNSAKLAYLSAENQFTDPFLIELIH